MQDKYTGDIGDFGKLGLLRFLHFSGLTIGVNWYLIPDEKHTGDGRHVQYLEDESICQCDEALWLELKSIVKSERREVPALQKERILNATFFSEPLVFAEKTKKSRAEARSAWNRRALEKLSGADVVFVDPDNGLIVPSVAGTGRENKFVKPDELAGYYEQGATVIYYQHKARRPDSFYTEQHCRLICSAGFEKATGLGMKFHKTSQRYFFFIVQPHHKTVITDALHKMMGTPWGNYFNMLSCPGR